MEQHKGTLKERWLSTLKGQITDPSVMQAKIDVDAVKTSVTRSVIEILYAVKRNELTRVLDSISSPHDVELFLLRYLPSETSVLASDLVRSIEAMNRRYKRMVDLRNQEDWASTWDHAKTFIYRTLTTLMIASIVLLTGFLAKLWDIPLPMLRNLGP